MEDSRFLTVPDVTEQKLRQLGLKWFADNIGDAYFVEDAVRVTRQEADAYAAFAKTCVSHFHETLDYLLEGDYREEFGLSPKLWKLATDTWRNRKFYPHAFGRFDVAGVVDGQPAKLIEFNADTATVLAEAALVQEAQLIGQPMWNDIVVALADQLIAVARSREEGDQDVLIVTLGGGEDDDNAQVWLRAAERAGLIADLAHLPDVTISPGEGVFREASRDEWYRYGIVVKMMPWDWIDAEEPELLDVLGELVSDNVITVLNPPYAALMQSKAMLAELYRRYPSEPWVLPAGFGKPPTQERRVVTKPIFGREGENVAVHERGAELEHRPGDFAEQPRIWQEYVQLPTDSDGDIYQAGVYWAGGACGLAYRRRDGLVVDDDSEFVCCVVED